MEKLENCNYAVELGRQLKFSLVGIAGKDISDGNPTLTLGISSYFFRNVMSFFLQFGCMVFCLALIWQLMRAYTLSILTQLADTGNPIVEKEIIDWVNAKLAAGKKNSSIRSFQDSSIGNARCVIDLIDCIKPGTVSDNPWFLLISST